MILILLSYLSTISINAIEKTLQYHLGFEAWVELNHP